MCNSEKQEFVTIVKGLDFAPRTFFDAYLIGDEVHFYRRYAKELLFKVCDKGLLRAFTNRKKLAAVVKSNQGDESIIQIVRHVDVHRHSGYSFLDGGSKISDMVKRTEYAGGIADHGGMYGTLSYYNAMTKAGKLPIIGFEAYAETIDGHKNGNHLLLIAKNKIGYQNLSLLTTLSQDNFYMKPHVSYDMLAKHSEGVISTTTCMGSEVSQLLLRGNYEEAKYVTKQYIDIFGKTDFYVEVQRHGFEEEEVVNPQLLRLARELDLKVIATTDAHYPDEDYQLAHEVLLCMGTKKKMNDPNRMKFPGTGYHIHSSDEIEELFKDIPEALDNTIEIAEKCSGLELGAKENYLPHFQIPKTFSNEMQYLRHISKEGFDKRFTGKPEHSSKEYKERLAYELDVIEGMGFPGYFRATRS